MSFPANVSVKVARRPERHNRRYPEFAIRGLQF